MITIDGKEYDPETFEGEAKIHFEQVAAIRDREYTACIASTDVHEYGKMLLEQVMHGLDIEILDGGVNADPDDLAALARDGGADFIALSTYNGMALS